MDNAPFPKEIFDKEYSTINGYSHVTKCNSCKSWIFYDDHHIKNHSVGGQVIKRTIHCNQCDIDIPLLAWRCL